MLNDSNRSVVFSVSLDLSSFAGSAPADGTIDPTSVRRYMQAITKTGTQTSPTVTNGQSVVINDVTVTFVTGALNLAGIIASINALSDFHHVVASNSASALQLTNTVGFENLGVGVSGSDAVLTALGFQNPTVTKPNSAGPTNVTVSRAKSRANDRWNQLVKLISYEASPSAVIAITRTGGDISSAPTALSFNVCYSNLANVYTYDESNSNVKLSGIPAIKRMVARALSSGHSVVVPVYDPTVATEGFVIGERTEKLEIAKLASNLAAAEAVVTVSVLTGAR